MKRSLVLIFISVCAVLCAFAAACFHTHDYKKYTVKSTCTEDGYYVYTCACGESFKESVPEFKALGHDYIQNEYAAPDCTHAGHKAYTSCSRCDYSTYEEIMPLGHDYQNHEGLAATCTEDGYKDYATCSRCYYSTYERIEPLGHDYQNHEGLAATCTEGGYKDYATCSRCDYNNYEELKPLGHDYLQNEYAAPDCTHAGHNAYTSCSRCDYSTLEEIKPLGHTFVKSAVRIFCASVCTACGHEEDYTHSFKDGGCIECGCAYGSFLDNFNGRYGYNYLGTMKNGKSLQALYNAIDEKVKLFHEKGGTVTGEYRFARVEASEYKLSADEGTIVWKTYRDDNPLYYWFANNFMYEEIQENKDSDFILYAISLYVHKEYADPALRTAENQEVYLKAGEWVKSVQGESSAYAAVRIFHDGIIQAVDYAYDNDGYSQPAAWAHGISGVTGGKGAVCEGYAKTFQMLLNICGIENVLVTGIAGEEEKEDHAWNMVKLDDGKWYLCDVTWDDASTLGARYDYFCAGGDVFSKDHMPATPDIFDTGFLYGLPECSKTAYEEEIRFNEKLVVDGIEYLVTGYNTLSLTRIDSAGEVRIPETVDYGGRVYSVAAIGQYNLNGNFVSADINNSVTSVFIPSTVNFIAYNNFYGIYSLEKIEVDENNLYYGSRDGVLFTKDFDVLIAFPNAHKSVAYAIPEESTQICWHAFGSDVWEGRKLETLTIHKNVNIVGVVDFFGWGYYNIVDGAWNDIVNSLTGEKKLIIDEENQSYKVKDGLIFNSDYTCVFASMPYNEDVVIPSTVKIIQRDAFWGNRWIKRVTLTDGWTSIQDNQFTYCYALESVYIPESVTYIGESAFFGCNLTRVIISDEVTYIGKYAFMGNSNLVSLTIGAGVEEIDEEAFGYCEKLVEVYNLSALEITAGSTDNGYAGYYADSVYKSSDIESKLTFTDDGLIFYNNNGKNYLIGYAGTQTELVLPESFNGGSYDIHEYAFHNFSGLTSVVIPECVNIIGEFAFYGSEVTSVEILGGVKVIGLGAFMCCSGLTCVTIPESVETIEEMAFAGCVNLNVLFRGTESDWEKINIGDGAFQDMQGEVIFGE